MSGSFELDFGSCKVVVEAVDFGRGGKLRAESEEEAVESVRACEGVEELELDEELEEEPCWIPFDFDPPCIIGAVVVEGALATTVPAAAFSWLERNSNTAVLRLKRQAFAAA